MKKNKYLKAKLTADTEEDCLYNTFWIYVAGISELLLIVMLQGELNYISIPCLIAAGFSLGVCAYKIMRHMCVSGKKRSQTIAGRRSEKRSGSS